MCRAKVNRETPDLVLHGGSLFDSEGRSPRVIEAFRDLNIYRTEDKKGGYCEEGLRL